MATPEPWWWREYPDRDCEYVRWYPPALTAEAAKRVWSDGREVAPPKRFGLYLHFPFCRTICPFCPFRRYVLRPGALEKYLEDLALEIAIYRETGYFTGEVEFIYLGGGTPSLMSPGQVEGLMELLGKTFRLSPTAEVTLEAHPLTATPDALKGFRRAGVTRLSLGLQSFDDGILRRLGTTHLAKEGRAAVDAAVAAGFPAVTIDLLFRVPGHTLDEWERDLAQAVKTDVPHVSCYSLVLDPDSPLQKALDRGKLPPQPGEETDQAMAQAAFAILGREDYHPYALCSGSGFSFARPGYDCRYDTSQWGAPQGEFLALGLSSYGFVRGYVTANTGSPKRYSEAVRAGRMPLAGAVYVDREEEMCRYMVLGVKLGRVPKQPFAERYGVSLDSVFGPALSRLVGWGLLADDASEVAVTEKGRLYMDNISKAFYSPAMYRKPQMFQGGEEDES